MCSIDFEFILNSDSDTCSKPKNIKGTENTCSKINVEINFFFQFAKQ